MTSSIDHASWITSTAALIDGKAPEPFSLVFAESGSFTHGNAPAVTTPAAICGFVTGFFGAIAGMKHTTVDHYSVGNKLTW